MTKLRMAQAPHPAVPRLYLRTAAVWGVVAGALLALAGETVLLARWSGAALAVVHAMTLGFLGNAMFGSLQQFLPVAVGTPVRGGNRAALSLFGLLNLGTLLLVAGFWRTAALAMAFGGAILLTAFLLLAGMVLPGLVSGAGERFLRQGIAGAVLASLVVACLGALLLLGLGGLLPLPLPRLADVHAAWGVLGWGLGLLAAVSRVVAPMFQGAAAAPVRAQALWQGLVYLVLGLLLMRAAGGELPAWLRIAVALCGLAFACGGLLLQLRSRRLRRVPLTGFWMAGLLALALAACGLLAGGINAVHAGTLAIGAGLPLLVTGMALEIIAFLGWIELQRACGRGVHLPGVQLLVPERDKYGALALHLASACVLVGAVLYPALARAAGVAMMLAHGATFVVIARARGRGRRFMLERGG